MPSASELLRDRMLLDGGMGTELIARGLNLREQPPELWNVERPGDVADIHRRYFEAGSEAVQTNTFGGNRIRLAQYGAQHRVRELNHAAVAIARESAPAGGIVIGSMGPSGGTPPPEGDADLNELEFAFTEQAMALAEAGVDLIHVETMFHPKEARAALRGCRIGAPGVPVIASLTCRLEGTVYSTGLGFAPEPIIQAFLEEGAEGLGVNCTLSPADQLDLVRLLRAKFNGPLFAKPTIAPTNQAPLLPGEFATGALALFAAGATAVGGCCGAGPADIAAARDALDELGAPKGLPRAQTQPW